MDLGGSVWLRTFTIALTISFICAVHAQVAVQLLEAGPGTPVPYGHVAYEVVGSGARTIAVTGPNGAVQLPLSSEQLTHGVALHISFVGFTSISDTLFEAAPRTYRLQRDPLALGDLVVTGQYAPGTPEAAVQKLRVIDAQQIRRMAANNLGDALRNQLNVRLAQDNVLGASLTMQGLGGENVKVLIDGVPVVGRQNGNVDLSQIDLTGIERIEVVEGPLSVNYGTNALAGTINLITRKGAGAPLVLKGSAYAEHIGRLNTTVMLARRWGRSNVTITGGRNAFSGWDPREQGIPGFAPQLADSERYQQWKPREQYFARVGYRWNSEPWSFGYKGELLHDRIVDRGRPRAPYNETAFDAAYVTQRLDNALFMEHRFGKGRRLQAQAAYNTYLRTRNTWLRDLTTLSEELVAQSGMQDTTRFDLTNMRATFASAPDSTALTYELGADINYETGAGERIAGDGRSIGDYALFASAQYAATRDLVLRPGARFAYNTRYGAPIIPSLNVRWRMNDGFTLRASYAQGFRAPSLKELYFYFVDVNHDIVGNEALKAERSQSSSVGLGYRHAREKVVYTSELNAFYNDVDDLITLAQVAGSRYTYVNVGRLRTAGGSIGAGWDNGHWIVSLGTSLTARRDALAPASDDPWWVTSEVRASVTKEWRRLGWSGSLFWKYQGQQVNYVLGLDGSVDRGSIASFHLADASLTKQLWRRRLALTAGCKDLFDVRNLQATSATGVHDAGGTSVPMTTGRTWFVRVELELKGKE